MVLLVLLEVIAAAKNGIWTAFHEKWVVCPSGHDSSVFPKLAGHWTWACVAIISSLPVRTQFLPAERGCNNEETAGDHLRAGQESHASAYRWKLPGEKPNGGRVRLDKENTSQWRNCKEACPWGGGGGWWESNSNVRGERKCPSRTRGKKVRDEVGSETEPTLNNPLRRSDLILLRTPCFQRVRLMPSVKIKVLTYRPFMPVVFKATLQSWAKGELLSTQHKSTC